MILQWLEEIKVKIQNITTLTITRVLPSQQKFVVIIGFQIISNELSTCFLTKKIFYLSDECYQMTVHIYRIKYLSVMCPTKLIKYTDLIVKRAFQTDLVKASLDWS